MKPLSVFLSGRNLLVLGALVIALGSAMALGARQAARAGESADAPLRTLIFPSNRSMGFLAVRSWGSGGSWRSIGWARGEVRVPRDNELQLTLDPHCPREDLSYLARLDARDVQILPSLRIVGADADDGSLAFIKRLTGLRRLILSSPNFTDSGLLYLKDLGRLKFLLVRCSNVGDRGLRNLRPLTSIEELCLYDTGITDPGLGYLSDLPGLRVLQISGAGITDAGVVHLEKLTSLEELALTQTGITGAGYRRLLQAMPDCNIKWEPAGKSWRAPDQSIEGDPVS